MHALIFIGLQASGKSSYYKEAFFTSHVRINLDMLRTRERERILFEACINARQPLVIDNTNPALADRQRYIPRLQAAGFEISAYYFRSHFATCLQRNNSRQGREKIPEKGLKATLNKLQHPDFNEGFQHIYYVNLTPHGYQVRPWKKIR